MASTEYRGRGVLNPHASTEHFTHVLHTPHPDLAAAVEEYWTVSWDLRNRPSFTAETLPNPSVNAVIESPTSNVWGVWTRKFQRELHGLGYACAIKFRAGGFYPFFRRPLSELTDRAVPFTSIFGDDCQSLIQEVLAS